MGWVTRRGSVRQQGLASSQRCAPCCQAHVYRPLAARAIPHPPPPRPPPAPPHLRLFDGQREEEERLQGADLALPGWECGGWHGWGAGGGAGRALGPQERQAAVPCKPHACPMHPLPQQTEQRFAQQPAAPGGPAWSTAPTSPLPRPACATKQNDWDVGWSWEPDVRGPGRRRRLVHARRAQASSCMDAGGAPAAGPRTPSPRLTARGRARARAHGRRARGPCSKGSWPKGWLSRLPASSMRGASLRSDLTQSRGQSRRGQSRRHPRGRAAPGAQPCWVE